METAHQLVGLTRSRVEALASKFCTRRREDGIPEPPAGKRSNCEVRSIVMRELSAGDKDTSEHSDATGMDEERLRLILRGLAYRNKIRRIKAGMPGVNGWPATWRIVK